MQPIPDNPTPVPTFPDVEQASRQIPLRIEQAQQAFARDLPELVQKRTGQWVAYYGERQLGFAQTKTGLYQECLRRGYEPGQFLVRLIRPAPGEITLIGPFEIG